MSHVGPTGTVWRKSSRSNGQTNCVEVAGALNAVRDSKHPDSPILNVNLATLIAAVKSGTLDR